MRPVAEGLQSWDRQGKPRIETGLVSTPTQLRAFEAINPPSTNGGRSQTFLRSKKFTAFLIGLIVLVLTQFFEVTQDVAAEIAGLIAAYVVGQGVADGLSKGATSNVAREVRS